MSESTSATLVLNLVDAVESADQDAVGHAMWPLRDKLRVGNLVTVGLLCSIAQATGRDTAVRSAALETLAGAKLHSLAELCKIIIFEFLESGNPDLQFTAIASASDLPKSIQLEFYPEVRKLVDETTYLGRAAQVFLREEPMA